VPSQTEFLLDIGASVIGRTKFCIHPKERIGSIPIIGGTKKFHFDKIRELAPDLIVGNKEENYEEGIQLLKQEFPVWMSDIYTLKDAFEMMEALGTVCGLEGPSGKIISECRNAMKQVKGSKKGRVLYLIWKNPWMAAGKNTFIDHMLSHLGYENVVNDQRYPELSSEEIYHLKPEKILFSSEPFPFKEKHLKEAEKIWPDSQCEWVDGELYSWYGSRLRNWTA
jgi:ABC-type Fe3+-hydroxamate transport system substrate-binding protein